jgi:2-oxo-4-hydroxy-4-carboxy-5-ureidoimidazoline decarboxylase
MPQPDAAHTVAAVGGWAQEAFTALLGGVFEHSPWVAQQAWLRRPFADVADLHAKMMQALRAAPPRQQLALLCAHPQLAGREAQSGTLTEASDSEQLGAGLKSLTPAELARMSALNTAYLARHGFPFIVCVRHYTKAGIFHELARRGALPTEQEMNEALNQVAAITRLRLDAIFPSD